MGSTNRRFGIGCGLTEKRERRGLSGLSPPKRCKRVGGFRRDKPAGSLCRGLEVELEADRHAVGPEAQAIKAIKGEIVSVHVIARPHSDVEAVLPKKK